VLVSPAAVAPSQMVGVYATVNLPLHHKVQKFSSGTGSPRCRVTRCPVFDRRVRFFGDLSGKKNWPKPDNVPSGF